MAIVICPSIEEIDRFVEAGISSDLILLLVFVFVIDRESVGGTEGERDCGSASSGAAAAASCRVWEIASMAEKGVQIAVRWKRG